MDEIEEIVIILGLIRSRRAGGLPAAGPVFLPAAAPSEYGDDMSIPEDEGAVVVGEPDGDGSDDEGSHGEDGPGTGSSDYFNPLVGGGGGR